MPKIKISKGSNKFFVEIVCKDNECHGGFFYFRGEKVSKKLFLMAIFLYIKFKITISAYQWFSDVRKNTTIFGILGSGQSLTEFLWDKK